MLLLSVALLAPGVLTAHASPGLLERAENHYKAKEYFRAGALFLELYELTSSLQHLYASANSFRMANDCELAVKQYRIWVALQPASSLDVKATEESFAGCIRAVDDLEKSRRERAELEAKLKATREQAAADQETARKAQLRADQAQAEANRPQVPVAGPGVAPVQASEAAPAATVTKESPPKDKWYEGKKFWFVVGGSTFLATGGMIGLVSLAADGSRIAAPMRTTAAVFAVVGTVGLGYGIHLYLEPPGRKKSASGQSGGAAGIFVRGSF
jgi:hypothetical protein